MAGIGVINNPHSRKNKKNPEWMQSLGSIVGSEGTCEATECIDDVTQLMQLFYESDIDILAINGGDGSNSVALTAMIDAYRDKPLPKIALLRGGTMNIAANSCGVKGTPSGLLLDLVRKYRDGETFVSTWRDTLQIEGRYGFVFGNGFIHRFLEVLYTSGNKSVWGASKMLSRGIGSALIRGPFIRELLQPLELNVTVDGKRLEQTVFSALAASTVEQIGLNFKPFHRWDEQIGTFHLLGVICSPLKIAASLPRFYRGRPVSQEKIMEIIAKQVRIEATQPIGYTLDGENFNAGKILDITVGPRLEMIVH